MIKLGVLISGRGTNLQAIIDAISKRSLDASIELVVSSKPEAEGLKRAEKVGISTLALSKADYASPLAADRRIAKAFKSAGSGTLGVDYVVMAGYMRKVHAPLLAAFPQRIVNVHPTLLPSFVGAHGIRDAYEYGVKITGVTIHFVNEDYDKGPIIAQRSIRIEEEDTLEDLEQKIHAVEHDLYPQTLQLLAHERVFVDKKGRTHIL